MPPFSRRHLRFVRALLQGGTAICSDGAFRAVSGASLPAADVAELIAAGVLRGDVRNCVATATARHWLKRQLLTRGAEQGQPSARPGCREGDLQYGGESPLMRLAAAGAKGQPFLEPHHVQAGERVQRLVDRAQLRQRVIMSYDLARTAGSHRHGPAAEIGDMAADARRQLAALHRALPRECADVLFDVCGLEKGLQLIEMERGWPRRSAKLVLRIGLDQAASFFGLQRVAVGQGARRRSWMGEGGRPPMFLDSDEGAGL